MGLSPTVGADGNEYSNLNNKRYMKVKDMIRSLMDKDLDDDVVIKVKARIYTNNNKGGTVECEATVDDVMPGNTPVLLSADITVNIESKVEMY